MITRLCLLSVCFVSSFVMTRPPAPAAPPVPGERAKPFTPKSLDGKASMREPSPKSLVLSSSHCPLCMSRSRAFVPRANAFAERGASFVMIYTSLGEE